MVFMSVIVGGVSPTIAGLSSSSDSNLERAELEYLFGQFGRKGFSKLWFLAAVLIPLAFAALCDIAVVYRLGGCTLWT
jgi:hypothetical protein